MLALIGWIGRILLILLIIRMVVNLFRGGARKPATNGSGATGSRGARGDRGARSEKAVAKLVRDPQCGTYVAETSAIAVSHGGTTVHFCSERCRDEYLATPRATAV